MRSRTIIRRVVWVILTAVTLVALFYAEEDWRGARAWSEAKAEAARAGESLDFAHFVPPPIPDDQNLAALPLFAQREDQRRKVLEPYSLEEALRLGSPQLLPGSWQRGESTDWTALRRGVAASYAVAFKGGIPLASPLAQFEAVYPFIAELRTASATRSRCRFDFDYSNKMLALRSEALLTDQIPLTQLVTLDALLALYEHEPETALDDLRAIFILESGMRRNPSVVAGRVVIGMSAISETFVWDGLALHAWNDSQLTQLQNQLGQIDFLSDYRFALQGELAGHVHDLPFLRRRFGGAAFRVSLKEDAENHQPINPPFPWPMGWLDSGMARLVRHERTAQFAVDVKNHRVYPDRARALKDDRNSALVEGCLVLPWNFLFMEMSMDSSNYASQVAIAQTVIDHSVIACALERYRLAHGAYPASLDALRPAFLASLPRDVIGGAPYRYRALPDGAYLLYSIGWNEKDDGGTLVYEKKASAGTYIDYDQGDWVWFGPR
jgi:hypothetical protein